jgi:cytochrome o ubiquinol oxidase subunit 2
VAVRVNKYLINFSKIALIGLVVLSLNGCNYELFDPKGPIAEEQMDLLIWSALIMLIVVIPVTIMGVWFPIKYRKNNKKQEYKPDWEHSNKIEFVVWTVPILIIIVLGVMTYITSYSLDPRKPIESEKKTMVIQVVAMDWKWLFIYPEHEIATVNEIAIPVDVPVEFLVTSDTVMNSFFVPQLGTQIYAMSGMENRVHLMASEQGTLRGFSANYSGFGFSGMKFSVKATDEQGFDNWINKVKNSQNPLDDQAFTQLQVKSKDVQPIYYSSVNPLLFSNIIEKYAGALNGQ